LDLDRHKIDDTDAEYSLKALTQNTVGIVDSLTMVFKFLI